MLLQSTGSRVKELIFHRGRNSINETEDLLGYDGHTKDSDRQPRIESKRLSWISQNSSDNMASRRNSTIMVRNRPWNHYARQRSSTTAQRVSSSSLYCNIDYKADTAYAANTIKSNQPKIWTNKTNTTKKSNLEESKQISINYSSQQIQIIQNQNVLKEKEYNKSIPVGPNQPHNHDYYFSDRNHPQFQVIMPPKLKLVTTAGVDDDAKDAEVTTEMQMQEKMMRMQMQMQEQMHEQTYLQMEMKTKATNHNIGTNDDDDGYDGSNCGTDGGGGVGVSRLMKSKKENPQQASTKLMLHSCINEAQATSSDKLMKGSNSESKSQFKSDSNNNLIHLNDNRCRSYSDSDPNPDTDTNNPNWHNLTIDLINDKEIPTYHQIIEKIHSISKEEEEREGKEGQQEEGKDKLLISSFNPHIQLQPQPHSYLHPHSHSHHHSNEDTDSMSTTTTMTTTTTATSTNSILDSNMVEFKDNVEQLIKETDEAFQAVGFALGDAKIATRGWQQYVGSNNGVGSVGVGNCMDTTNRMDKLDNSHPHNNSSTDIRQLINGSSSSETGNNPIPIITARTNTSYAANSFSSKRDLNLMKTSQESESNNNNNNIIGSTGKSPVPKSIVASKTKKSNSPKQKKHSSTQKSSRKSLPHPHSSARWNLGDVTASMADVFTGKMFAKIEVDEMLTPDRRQQLEEKAKLDIERKASLESAQNEAARNAEVAAAATTSKEIEGSNPIDKSHDSEGNQVSETDIITSPTEPFHLENLLSRLNKSSDSPSIPGPTEPLSATTPAAPELPEKSQQNSLKPLPNLPSDETTEIDAIEQAFEELNFPSPPRDAPSPTRNSNVPRSRSNTGITNLLPTIPEISPFHITSSPPRTPKRSLSQDSEYSQDSQISTTEADVDYIRLPSTPFTLTSPLFRHGMIRLEYDVYGSSKNRRDSVTSPEEALDWTAFQMAISGTMDDGGFGVDEDSIWEADEAEVDGILDWWNGFGYQGIGRLVKEASPSRRKRGKSDTGVGLGLGLNVDRDTRKSRSTDRESKLTPTNDNLGLGIQTPFPSSNINIAQNQQQQQIPIPTRAPPPPGQGARRDVVLKVNIDPPSINKGDNNNEEEEDDDSPPPSPITLVKIKDEFIPMGYNLGHDLGDFLNWETYHVQNVFGEGEGEG